MFPKLFFNDLVKKEKKILHFNLIFAVKFVFLDRWFFLYVPQLSSSCPLSTSKEYRQPHGTVVYNPIVLDE